MTTLASILETFMIISFGITWPVNLIKAYKSRSAKGKSVLFDYFIFFGYICGILAKTITRTFNLAYYFYFINLVMVLADIILYYHNRKLDQAETKIS